MPFKNPHPLYSVWHGMIQRCSNPSFRQWADYGGRGISVCPQWSARKGVGFRQFVSDMGPRPDGYTLDRIDNDLGYSPENCRWASRKEQQRNQRVTVKVLVEGVEYLACDLAERAGLKTETIVARARHNLTLTQILDSKRRVFTEGLSIGWKYGRSAGKHRSKADTQHGSHAILPGQCQTEDPNT